MRPLEVSPRAFVERDVYAHAGKQLRQRLYSRADVFDLAERAEGAFLLAGELEPPVDGALLEHPAAGLEGDVGKVGDGNGVVHLVLREHLVDRPGEILIRSALVAFPAGRGGAPHQHAADQTALRADDVVDARAHTQ